MTIGNNKKAHLVDIEGDSYDEENPLPVKVKDLEVQADTIDLDTSDLEALLTTLNGHVDGLDALLTALRDRTNVSGVIYDSAGNALTVKRAFANVAASQTDASLVAAVGGKKLRTLQALSIAGGTATNLTFNSKPAGAGSAISPLLANGVNGGEVLPFSPHGWFETATGEGLSVTTGAGSASGLLVAYAEV